MQTFSSLIVAKCSQFMYSAHTLRDGILQPEQGRPTSIQLDLPSWEVLGLLLELPSLSFGWSPALHSLHKCAFRAKTSVYFSDMQVIKGVFIFNFNIMWKFSSHKTALYSNQSLLKGVIVFPMTVSKVAMNL